MLTLSHYIDRIRTLIESLGCGIVLFDHTLDHIGGRIDYQKREIRLNCPSAQDALLTLAHEGGHWVAYLLYGERPYQRPLREVLANHFGWDLLLVVGADSRVTHQMWLEQCREDTAWAGHAAEVQDGHW